MAARSGFVVLLLVALGLGPSTDAQGHPRLRGLGDPLVVETSEGPVRGAMESGVLVFRGIPFAAAPVGARRWLPPAPPPARPSTLDALAFGAACPQPRYPGIQTTSEDCLFLNVWAPTVPGSYPVLFWMHGGAFVVNSGGNARFDGTALAQRGVVVVTVNYRLGVLGIFAHPALTAERPAGPLANFALMDQLAALRWVRQNIRGFGGDPQNVTISGSSAGATSSLFLMTSGASAGLFQKVIVQSGGAREGVLDLPQEELAGSSFARSLGVPADASAAAAVALRALPAEEITKANGAWEATTTPPLAVKPIVDDDEASAEDDANAIIRQSPNDAFVPGGAILTPAAFLIGSTDGESCGRGCPQGAISSITPAGAFATDLDRARAVAATGAKTYLYYFRFVPGKPGESADHGASVEYTFGTSTPGDPEAVRISGTMMDYWVSFLKTGVPASGDGPAWARYDPEKASALVFSNAEEGGVGVLPVLSYGVAPPPTSQPVTLETTIPLPSAPHSLFYNPVENKVYSANTEANSVTVIDGATNQVLATIPVAAGPRAFGHDRDRGRVFTANYSANNLSVIDARTDRVVATVPTGGGPRDLVYDPASRKLYCVNESTNDVTVVDGETLAVIATVPVGATPRVLCHNATNGTIAVANSAASSVTVIDAATDRAVATVKVGNVPKGIVLDPKHGKLYVTNYGSDSVTVIDAATNAVRGTIPVGKGPSGIFYDAVNDKVYCAVTGEPGPGNRADSVVVIDGATDGIVRTLAAEDEPTAFDLLPAPNLLAWVNEWSDSVSIVDGGGGGVLQVVEVGRQPVDVVANPLQNRLYVGTGLGKSITVLRAEGQAPAPAARWLLPSAARSPGAGRAFYTTDLAVANTGATDATLTLKFLGHDADGRGGPEKTFALAAGRAATYGDLLGAVFGVDSGYGAVRLSSSTTALAVTSLTATPSASGGTFGQSVPAFSEADLVREGLARTIVAVREDASFRTNLVLASAVESPLDVDVALLADTGATLASGRYALPPLGMRQVTRVVRDLGVSGDVAGARLVVSTPTPGGAFAAYAALIDNATNDPRTLLPSR